MVSAPSPSRSRATASVFDDLTQLCGTHRIQRVPVTEKKGRRHSSSVSVAILDENATRPVFSLSRDEIDLQIARGSGNGGQKRNKTETAVVAVHRPTGKRVRIDSRSQGQNKKEAVGELERRLADEHEVQGALVQNEARVRQIEDDRTFNWCGWRDEVLNHRNGRRTSMAKALRGKLDPVLDK